MRGRWILGIVMSLCFAGSAFAVEARTEAPKWEQGYGQTAIDGKTSTLAVLPAEAPRMCSENCTVVAALFKRPVRTMIAVGNHFELKEVAAKHDAVHEGKAKA